MTKITKRFARFWKVEDGPTAVEYLVMLALLIVACVTAIGNLGTQANATFSPPGAKLTATGS